MSEQEPTYGVKVIKTEKSGEPVFDNVRIEKQIERIKNTSELILMQSRYIMFLENHLDNSIRDSGNLNYMDKEAVKQGEELRIKISDLTDKLK
jgi:hypothetical protein